jgi:hypothetical protein
MLELSEPTSEGKPSWLDPNQADDFTFRKPPNAAWWRKTHSLTKQAAYLCYRLQYDFSVGNINYLGKRYFVERTSTLCENLAGISPSTFERARDEAVHKGLITYEVHKFGQRGEMPTNRLYVRPTNKFLQPFGVTLLDYDTWGRLAKLKSGKPKKGDLAPSGEVMSQEEIAAYDRWEAALDKKAESVW